MSTSRDGGPFRGNCALEALAGSHPDRLNNMRLTILLPGAGVHPTSAAVRLADALSSATPGADSPSGLVDSLQRGIRLHAAIDAALQPPISPAPR